MNQYTEHMHQCATYWPPGANDGYGNLTAAPPQPTRCRWQNVAQLFRTPEGREVVSQAVVYTAIPVRTGGRLLLGESAARTPPGDALEILQVDTSPSLDGEQVLTKAYL